MALAADRRSRALALGLLVLALGLAYLLGLHWWWTAPLLDQQQQLQDLRDAELRLRMNVAQRDAIQRQLARVQAFEQGNTGFLPEASAQLATAGLVQRFSAAVDQASPVKAACQISNSTPLNTRVQERYPRVVVQVRIRCGIDEFVALLYALEGGAPQLFIDNLSILARRYLRDGDTGGAGANALDISFELYGYLRIPTVRTQAEAADADA